MDMAGKVASGVCSVVGHSDVRAGCAFLEYAIRRIIAYRLLDNSRPMTLATSIYRIVHNQASKSCGV